MKNDETWYKKDDGNKVWWLEQGDVIGKFIFSFDKKKRYNLFADYPNKLSKQERAIFDRENPYWVNFFADRG